MAKKEKKEVADDFLQSLIAASGSEYAQLMGDEDEDKYPIADWIDSGNILLNCQLSANPYGGMPSGKILQLAGKQGSTKTITGLNLMKRAQQMGYYCMLFDSEFANNDKDTLKKFGIDTERLAFFPVATVEELKTAILKMLDRVDGKHKLFMMVDSIGNLSTLKELTDSSAGTEKKDMTRPAQLKALFRTCTLKAGMKGVPIVVINHTYAAQTFIPQNVLGGGEGPAYMSSIILEFTKAQEKDSDNKTVGAVITSKAIKNRFAKEKTKIKYILNFKDGLSRYSGLLDFFLGEGLLVKDGNKSFKIVETGGVVDKKDLSSEFWDEQIKGSFGTYLKNYFKYCSFSDLMESNQADSDNEPLEENL